MATFYMDYENGIDATTNTPLGWWSVAYTAGDGTQPVADETATGATSGSTAKVTVVVVSSGTWAGGDAAGTIYWYGKSAAFQAETLNFAVGGASCSIGADFTYCAWKTMTTGATAARIAPGDIIRIAKSPAPSSIGNATWTNLSKTVTLASAQTANIDVCDSAWTASANVTQSLSNTRKEGTKAVSLAIASAFTTGLVGYREISADGIDFSAYQKISFWWRGNLSLTGQNFTIKLCSDTAGATPVDSFTIPAGALIGANYYRPLTIAKDGGGNLGSAIKSVAIYCDTDPGTYTILIDNIIACTTNGLNLQSLISKNSAEQGGTEGWFGMKSINDTTVLLDNTINEDPTSGKGYSGATETVATYKRETVKTVMVTGTTTASQTFTDSGTAGNLIEYQGGYTTSTNAQDGETFFDGLNGLGYGISVSNKQYNLLNYLNMHRYSSGIYFGSSNNNTINIMHLANNTSYGFLFSDANNMIINTVSLYNNSYGIYFSSCFNVIVNTITANNNFYYNVYCDKSKNIIINTITNANNGTFGLYLDNSNDNVFNNLSTSGNATAGIFNNTGKNYLNNALITEAIEMSSAKSFANSRVYSTNHDQTAGYYYIYTDNGNIVSDTAVRHTASGISWKLSPTDVIRSSLYPLDLSIAKIACSANNQVTVKAWFKKTHASDIGAKLIIKGGQIAGVASDVSATKADDTDWEELTIQFTPTEEGVVEIEAHAYWVANAADDSIYVDDMTITQA